MKKRGKVLVAMSGGVDSSVAAALLVQQGYDVVGCFMRLGSPGEYLEGLIPGDGPCGVSCTPAVERDRPDGRLTLLHRGCCSLEDATDARAVAGRLGIPFYVCNFKRDFGRVVDYFVREYNDGRTPNPCIRCNDWLKFGRLFEYADSIGAEFIASGHYARVMTAEGGGPALCRGVDPGKDQSYVLFGLARERLRRLLLPIGSFAKPDVRAMARAMDLPVSDKPDSQEICFVPDDDYAGLIDRVRPGAIRAGEILDLDGAPIGTHAGHQHFTIGQRRRIGVALGHPVFVVARDPVANTVTVGPREATCAEAVVAGETNWLVPAQPSWRSCTAQYRAHGSEVPARLRADAEGVMEVAFDGPVEAVAPGQAIVCYDGDRVLAGGWIREVRPAPGAVRE